MCLLILLSCFEFQAFVYIYATWEYTMFVPGEISFIVSAKTSTSNQFKILKKFRNDCVSL
jgi:hypothetical protein